LTIKHSLFDIGVLKGAGTELRQICGGHSSIIKTMAAQNEWGQLIETKMSETSLRPNLDGHLLSAIRWKKYSSSKGLPT